ncbi:MAG: hypothetical protein M1401_20030 [Chloroflexi bacterium]|nr:hypothetical protein [Chloroflexota bacterium]
MVETARNQSLVNYGEIAPLAGLDLDSQEDRNTLGRLLGEISTFEHSQRRPMLSAVVVYLDANAPGPGFYKLARELGLLAGHDPVSELEFYIRELRSVYATWRT